MISCNVHISVGSSSDEDKSLLPEQIKTSTQHRLQIQMLARPTPCGLACQKVLL